MMLDGLSLNIKSKGFQLCVDEFQCPDLKSSKHTYIGMKGEATH